MSVVENIAESVGVEVAAVSRKTKLLMAGGVCLAMAVFTFCSRAFGVPVDPGFSGSVLRDGSWLTNLLIVAAGLFVSVAVATLIVGRVRFDAGLFCATVGMTVLSIRGGTMRQVLQAHATQAGTALFVSLAVELVVLYALVAVAWSALWSLHRGGVLNADEFRDGVEDTDEPVLFKALAMLMQVGVMGLIVLLLAPADGKAQAIAAVAVASLIGAWAAYMMYPISPSPWLWVGPLVVGVVGYLLAYFNVPPGDPSLRIGDLRYPLAPLARPLPIDYASAGPAGALLGYWVARRGHRQRVAEAAAQQQAATVAQAPARPSEQRSSF
jgi:hypothetical protein